MGRPQHGPLDRTTFEQVIAEYADRLYGIALRITGSPADAEDALQEAFVSAYRGLAQYRGDANPRTWLYRITVNAALYRLRARPPQEYLDELSEPSDATYAWAQRREDAVLAAELHEQLELALRNLPGDYRAAVILRDVEGLSAREAALVLDISEAALKSRLHRGRLLLRQSLEDYLSG